MDKQVNYSMKGKAPIIILSVLFLNLAIIECIRDFASGIMHPYGSNIMGMVNSIVMLIASIMFASFMFKGQTKTRGSLPGACMIWGLMDVIAMIGTSIIYSVEFLYYKVYSTKAWVIAIIMFVAFVMMMVSAINRFENRVLFYISAGLGLAVQLYDVCTYLKAMGGYYRGTNILGELVTLLFVLIFFLFGSMNRTVEVEEPEQAAPPAPQGRYYNGVYIPAQSVAESGRNPYAPVYAPPVAPAPVQSEPVEVKVEPNGDLSPEYQLLFWKENFEKGIITEDEYFMHRDQVLREHFGK